MSMMTKDDRRARHARRKVKVRKDIAKFRRLRDPQPNEFSEGGGSVGGNARYSDRRAHNTREVQMSMADAA